MISKVEGRNFKGLTFSQPLGRLNLFVGPNGSGKSARTQALILGIMGYIPGGAKKNAEILEAYGSDNTMVVGFEAGALLERGFVRAESGSVAQGYKVAGAKVKETDFIKALALHGDPKIVDISAFMDLSDQKKIDAIFALYPPAGDVGKIQANIDSTKTKINELEGRARSAENAAAALLQNKPQLPPGTLAETTGKIEETTQALADARAKLSLAEQAESARIATEKAEKKAATEKIGAARRALIVPLGNPQAYLSDEVLGLMVEGTWQELYTKAQSDFAKRPTPVMKEAPPYTVTEENFLPPDNPTPAGYTVLHTPGEMLKNSDLAPNQGFSPSRDEALDLLKRKAADSLQLIIDALDKIACKDCSVVRMIAAREIRKYKEVK